ncbi:hypothetical protein [Haloferax elongans]|uniref:hypothetical protein n=1 Tax=Haloferax elongans TaxID=403191 RepID=UPI0012676E9E|nr:hypothetical protein [Haloferax elongans]
MSPPEKLTNKPPISFETALAYALHREMRRLIIVFIAGVFISNIGLVAFFGYNVAPEYYPIPKILGLIVAIIGLTLLFGGLVGSLFKLVVDATSLN